MIDNISSEIEQLPHNARARAVARRRRAQRMARAAPAHTSIYAPPAYDTILVRTHAAPRRGGSDRRRNASGSGFPADFQHGS